MSKRAVKLTDRELQVLGELQFQYWNQWELILRGKDPLSNYDHLDKKPGWCRCMDVGGTDASWHSKALLSLKKKGYVRRRGRWWSLESVSLRVVAEECERIRVRDQVLDRKLAEWRNQQASRGEL